MRDTVHRRGRSPAAVTLSATLLGLAGGVGGCGPADGAGAPGHPVDEQVPAAPPYLGFAINAHHIDDLQLYLESVDAIAETGANAMLLVTPMFQDRVDSSAIHYLADKCPTDEQLLAILARAHRRGLHTTLLPIVLIASPGEKDWRGVIRPDDPDAWWESYRLFLDHYLDVAAAAGVDMFSIGSEFNSMEDRWDRWDGLIDHARSRFEGALTYTANWDHYESVTFWPRLDCVSISSYFELSRGDPDAPVATLTDAWRRQRLQLQSFAEAQGLPLMLMELGYPSLPWAAAHPWNYVADEGTRADHAAQARCYRAFFDAWSDALAQPGGGVLGVHCYLWDPYHHGRDADTGYGVRGKPALEVIKSAFGRIRRDAAEGR